MSARSSKPKEIKQGCIYKFGIGYILVFRRQDGQLGNVILDFDSAGNEGSLMGERLTKGSTALKPRDFVCDLAKIMEKVRVR